MSLILRQCLLALNQERLTAKYSYITMREKIVKNLFCRLSYRCSNTLQWISGKSWKVELRLIASATRIKPI